MEEDFKGCFITWLVVFVIAMCVFVIGKSQGGIAEEHKAQDSIRKAEEVRRLDSLQSLSQKISPERMAELEQQWKQDSIENLRRVKDNYKFVRSLSPEELDHLITALLEDAYGESAKNAARVAEEIGFESLEEYDIDSHDIIRDLTESVKDAVWEYAGTEPYLREFYELLKDVKK